MAAKEVIFGGEARHRMVVCFVILLPDSKTTRSLMQRHLGSQADTCLLFLELVHIIG